MQSSKIVDVESDEALCLKKEFEWVLTEEVRAVLNQLHTILIECMRRFPIPLRGNEIAHKQEKYILTAAPDKLKTVLSVNGDNISQADIQFRVQRQHQSIIYRTYIQNEHPWKLHQMQDAGNHLQQALLNVENVQKDCTFCSSDEVLHVFERILGCLQRGRTCLIVPKKKSVEELMKIKNANIIFPSVPDDLAVNFYIQSHKLILGVYQFHGTQGLIDVYQSECTIPWLNEVLVFFTVALQICQQLKDKICVFAQYKDFTMESRRPSNVTIQTE